MTLSSIKQSPSLDPPKTSRKPYDVKGRGGRVEEAVLSLGNQKDFNGDSSICQAIWISIYPNS
jgi:hypothetical protein